MSVMTMSRQRSDAALRCGYLGLTKFDLSPVTAEGFHLKHERVTSEPDFEVVAESVVAGVTGQEMAAIRGHPTCLVRFVIPIR
jgi:hypothetical protein